jgi:DNA-directed RNA polymerase specialized sigma subunit
MRKLTFGISKKQFVKLYKIYKTDTELAKALNVSRQYTWYLRKKFNIELKSETKTDRNKMIYTDNKLKRMPKIDIAKRHNLSRMTVHRILKSMEA